MPPTEANLAGLVQQALIGAIDGISVRVRQLDISVRVQLSAAALFTGAATEVRSSLHMLQ